MGALGAGGGVWGMVGEARRAAGAWHGIAGCLLSTFAVLLAASSLDVSTSLPSRPALARPAVPCPNPPLQVIMGALLYRMSLGDSVALSQSGTMAVQLLRRWTGQYLAMAGVPAAGAP